MLAADGRRSAGARLPRADAGRGDVEYAVPPDARPNCGRDSRVVGDVPSAPIASFSSTGSMSPASAPRRTKTPTLARWPESLRRARPSPDVAPATSAILPGTFISEPHLPWRRGLPPAAGDYRSRLDRPQ